MSATSCPSFDEVLETSVRLARSVLRSDFAAVESAELRLRAENIAAWLAKKHGGRAGVDALVDHLRSCDPEDHCLSPACPVCAAAAQQRLTTLLEKATRRVQKPEQAFFVSVMPAAAATSVRRLREFDRDVLADLITGACKRAQINWAVFAIDLSINEHRTGRYKPFVMPHVHGVVITDDVKTLRRELKDACPSTDAIPRPVRITPWDGNTAAFNYLMKVRLERRIGIDDAVRFDPRTGTNRLCRAIQRDRPRSRERRELLLAFDRIGIDGRLILVNTALRRMNGRIRIVPKHPVGA